MHRDAVDFDPYSGRPSISRRLAVVDAGRCLERMRFHLTQVYLLYSRPIIPPKCNHDDCECYKLLVALAEKVISDRDRHFDQSMRIVATLRALVPQFDDSPQFLDHLDKIQSAFAVEGELDRLTRIPRLNEDGSWICTNYLNDFIECDPRQEVDPSRVALTDPSDGTPMPTSLAARLAAALEAAESACRGCSVESACDLFQTGRWLESVLCPMDVAGLLSYRTPPARIFSPSISLGMLAKLDFSCERGAVVEGGRRIEPGCRGEVPRHPQAKVEDFRPYDEFIGRALYIISREPGDLVPQKTVEPRLLGLLNRLGCGARSEQVLINFFGVCKNSDDLLSATAELYGVIASVGDLAPAHNEEHAHLHEYPQDMEEFLDVQVWKDQVWHGGKLQEVDLEGIKLLRALVKAKGDYVSARRVVTKPSRVFKKLPKPIQLLIDRSTRGYRLQAP